MPNSTLSVDDIDALLPQTQCGLCEYPACRPYAEAIAQGERIDKCLPGGVDTLRALGNLLHQDPEPYVQSMQQKTKPAMLAVIREAECIGCTKCIQACPVDAIVGANKQMHTVILEACTGCGLCVAPCPVDCIDMLEIPRVDVTQQKRNANQWRTRYQQRNQRLQNQHAQTQQYCPQTLEARKQVIADAIERTKQKGKNA